MTAILDPQSADRLVKLLGMCGSDHDGERASAALLADKLVRGLGLTWPQVIAVRPGRNIDADNDFDCSESDDLIAFALSHVDSLSEWELSFVRSLRNYARLSPKQRRKMQEIVNELRGAP